MFNRADSETHESVLVGRWSTVDRRAALRAECQTPCIPTLGGFEIELEFARGEREGAGFRANDGSKGSARLDLAIGAMAHEDLVRIDPGVETNGTTKTTTADLHATSIGWN